MHKEALETMVLCELIIKKNGVKVKYSYDNFHAVFKAINEVSLYWSVLKCEEHCATIFLVEFEMLKIHSLLDGNPYINVRDAHRLTPTECKYTIRVEGNSSNELFHQKSVKWLIHPSNKYSYENEWNSLFHLAQDIQQACRIAYFATSVSWGFTDAISAFPGFLSL